MYRLLRFRLSALFVLILVAAAIAWWFAVGIELYRDYQDYLALQRTKEYELIQAKTAAGGEIPGLVTILGESRFKHWDEISQIAVLSDRRYISCGIDNAVRIWNRDGSVSKVYEGFSVAVAQGGSCYSISRDGGLDVYDATDDQLVYQWEMGFDSRKTNFSLSKSGRFVGYGSETSCGVYDLKEKKEVISVANNVLCQSGQTTPSFPQVRVSPNGQLMAVSQLSQIYLFDSGSHLITVFPEHRGVSNPIFNFMFDLTGTKVIHSDSGGLLRIYNIRSQEIDIAYLSLDNEARDIEAFALTTDGLLAYCLCGHQILTVDMQIRNYSILNIVGLDAKRPAGDDDLPTRAIAYDEKYLLCTDYDGKIRRLDIHSANSSEDNLLIELAESSWNINCIEFTPNGKQMIAGCNDGVIRCFNVDDWQMSGSIDTDENAIQKITISRDGKYLAYASCNCSYFGVIDLQRNSHIFRSKYGSFSKNGLSFTPDNKLVFSNSYDDQIIVFDIPDLNKDWEFLLFPRAPSIHAFKNRANYTGREVFATADSKWLLTCSQHHSVAVWNLPREKLQGYIGEQGKIDDIWGPFDHQFFISPDEKLVATIGDNGVIQIHSMDELRKLNDKDHIQPKPMVLKDDFGLDARVAFSHDGKLILTTGRMGAIKFWDRKSGSYMKTIKLGPAGCRVSQIKISKDDRYFVTCNGNGTVYVFRMPKYHELLNSKKR